MNKAEYTLIAVSIFALGMNFFLIPGGELLSIFTLLILSMLYFYLGIALFTGVNLKDLFDKQKYSGISTLRIVGAVGVGISLSFVLIGILFKIQVWPFPEITLGVGLFGLFIVTLISIIKYFSNKSSFYTNILKRTIVFSVVGLVLMFSAKTCWIDLKYRNHPEYLEAFKKAIEEPNNPELWDAVRAEKEKLNK